MTQDSLGDRMKGYENVPRIKLTPRLPIIIRIDGKSFHTYTKGFERPWDRIIQNAMSLAAMDLLKENIGAEIAYIQSDEISLVLNTYKRFKTKSWFDGNVQKIASVSASIATYAFNSIMSTTKRALFDSRCFVMPKEDVVNYFIWRQQDAIRNSVSSLAQSKFPHKSLQGKNSIQMKQMLSEINCPWENVSIKNQRGWCVIKKLSEEPEVLITSVEEDNNIPLFQEQRDYINKFLEQDDI